MDITDAYIQPLTGNATATCFSTLDLNYNGIDKGLVKSEEALSSSHSDPPDKVNSSKSSLKCSKADQTKSISRCDSALDAFYKIYPGNTISADFLPDMKNMFIDIALGEEHSCPSKTVTDHLVGRVVHQAIKYNLSDMEIGKYQSIHEATDTKAGPGIVPLEKDCNDIKISTGSEKSEAAIDNTELEAQQTANDHKLAGLVTGLLIIGALVCVAVKFAIACL